LGEQRETATAKRLFVDIDYHYRAVHAHIGVSRGIVNQLEFKFLEFHFENPQVYAALLREARKYRAIHGPLSKVGIATLWEHLRWGYYMDTTTNEGFKLPNNHRAYYARLLMSCHVELAGLFKTKELRS
jgi:hypothetical protein